MPWRLDTEAIEWIEEETGRRIDLDRVGDLVDALIDATSDDEAGRARAFNTWVKKEWLADYKARTGLANVAVFDWFDLLAYPDDHSEHPNRLRREYGGDSGDSHTSNRARLDSTAAFAMAPGNVLDVAWEAFAGMTQR